MIQLIILSSVISPDHVTILLMMSRRPIPNSFSDDSLRSFIPACTLRVWSDACAPIHTSDDGDGVFHSFAVLRTQSQACIWARSFSSDGPPLHTCRAVTMK